MTYQPAKLYMIVYHNPNSAYAPFFTFYPPQVSVTRREAEKKARDSLRKPSTYSAHVYLVESSHAKITATHVSTPVKPKE